MKALLLTAVTALALAFSGSALAADPTTFGAATIDGGVAKLVSDTSVANTPNDDFSGVTLPLPAGLTLAQVTQLSTEFNVTDDDCAAGSPRFAINYGPNKNVFVYLGPSPSFTGCAKDTWLSSGNLVGTSEAGRVDTSQVGGSVNSTWAAALALVGTQPIVSISLVVDSSWSPVFADKEQTVLVRNVKLNNETFLVPATPKPPKVNPTTACKAQLATLGRTAFNELWADKRHVERHGQVRLDGSQGSQSCGHAVADHECVQDLQSRGPQGRQARRVRRSPRRRRGDADGEAGAKEGQGPRIARSRAAVGGGVLRRPVAV